MLRPETPPIWLEGFIIRGAEINEGMGENDLAKKFF